MNQKGGRSATLERWADKVEDVLRPHACGLTHAQVADKACLSISTTSKALATSAKRGGVIFMRLPGSKVVWWHYEHRAVVHARTAKAKALSKARSKARVLQVELSAFDKPMVHRIIPATEAVRLSPKGPNSVWGLAA